ncbi:carbon catabolite-derepressing kinase [Rhizoctonia solani 123E]|uniref:non-specific serine/threonine protein kinase n=1 Tax=Rhizoctonia solani 123E TaxID=1423351 RepID=A0A074S849_9AGAM|nr:carbon catabolite-derepressing kinase [Rhizoctonia solani 123E]
MSSREPSVEGRKRLGEYKVIKNIGEGSFGHVKLAIHTLTGQKVALKYFSKARIKNMKLGARVTREIQYLRLLDHPHIVKIYEVINTSTDIIMVIEFAGAELFDTLAKHGRLPEETARSIFQQLVSAVAHSHKYKVIHRDLKPENILIDWSGPVPDVKVIDFGLSNVMTDGDFLRTSCGSPCYACPDLIRVYAGPEVDVWSIGVILYLMLAGRLPFEDESTHVLMDKICTGRYHMPSNISPDAANLIKNCIVVNPIKRLTMPEIMQHPWFLAGLPKYLRVAPQTPNLTMRVESLSYILAPQKEAQMVPESSWPVPELVDELAEAIGGSKEDVLESLSAEGDNAIKVAYNIAKDKRRKTLDWSERMRTQEEVSDVAATTGMMPNLMGSNPNQRRSYETDSTAYDTDDEWEFDWNGEEHNIAVLDSSLPAGQTDPDAHRLTSYVEAHANAEPQEQMRTARTANPTTDIRKKTKWHFGIRSRSPPMEVMLELYNTLKALGWEWREKPNLGKQKALAPGEEVDPREESDIFFLETRCRINDVVVHAINYLVDFRNVGYYHATVDPANKSPFAEIDNSQINGGRIGGEGRKIDDITSPFLFLESACRLIQQLAGV